MERRVKAIQQKLDRLDDAFLFAEAMESTKYEQQRDRLREEFTLLRSTATPSRSMNFT